MVPAIDWSRPWLMPYRRSGEAAAAMVAAGSTVAGALNQVLSSLGGLRLGSGDLRFVAQGALPEGEAYEAFIHRTARVPTRDNLHDFFNGLMWVHWPVLKRRLNELQALALAAHGVRTTRGPLRDALTLFDENAALLQAPVDVVQRLRERDWKGLLFTQRDRWQREVKLTLFGHALLEKLVTPYKSITAHVWVGVPGADLDAATLVPKPFLPLPVLGVPGWWPDNEVPGFYDDVQVFRPLQPQAGRKPSIER
jgi:hypothetical protein